MARFGFTKRKTLAPEETAAPSFRVLDRSEVAGGFHPPPKVVTAPDGFRSLTGSGGRVGTGDNGDLYDNDDNIFAGMKMNRGSGSSTTKTASTDASSRHSGASTAPSSAAHNSDHDDPRNTHGHGHTHTSHKPLPKSSTTGGLLSRAGRTFSFGSKKGYEEDPDVPPPVPQIPHDVETRPRGMTASTTTTASTASTAMPPRVGDLVSRFDLGGDFGSMFGSGGIDGNAQVPTKNPISPYEETSSIHDSPAQSIRSATINNNTSENRNSISTVTGRSLTASRPAQSQPSPLHLDRHTQVEPSPFSYESRTSHDGLLRNTSPKQSMSPQLHSKLNPCSPPPPDEDEDTALLRGTLMASSLLTEESTTGGQSPRVAAHDRDRSMKTVREAGEDNMFDNTAAASSRPTPHYGASSRPSPTSRNRVMTPAQFEKYKNERPASYDKGSAKSDDEDDVNYEDDDDELEKNKQLSKQRKKQEAHMAVYRQQMMKVTGEPAPGPRPPITSSLSAPNGTSPSPGMPSDAGSDEDEEVPLAILAAHGFPNKNKPPARLSQVLSNPNLRQSLQPSYQRPGSAAGQQQHQQQPGGEGQPGNQSSTLPAFARGLPQDPFVGAGLVRHAPRESLSMSGGAQLPPVGATPGGLVGIIASEERAKALRRGGSPNIEANAARNAQFQPTGLLGNQYNAVSGPGHAMHNSISIGNGFGGGMGSMGMGGGGVANPRSSIYSMGGTPSMPQLPMMNGQDQMAQMQQLMQMQMQFMQMQMALNAQQTQAAGMRPISTVGSISGMPPMMLPMNMGMSMDPHASYMGPEPSAASATAAALPPRMDNMRTMSMVQPSSTSWIQKPNFAPSIRMQGGYAPSIAPSERSNIGLPGRYRAVSQMPVDGTIRRVSSMMDMGAGPGPQVDHLGMGLNRIGANGAAKNGGGGRSGSVTEEEEDDDDDEGWEAMKAKRDKKQSLWKSKKGLSKDIGALIL